MKQRQNFAPCVGSLATFDTYKYPWLVPIICSTIVHPSATKTIYPNPQKPITTSKT